MSEAEFVAFSNSKPLRKEFMLAMGRKGFSDAEMKAALDRLGRTLDRMERRDRQERRALARRARAPASPTSA